MVLRESIIFMKKDLGRAQHHRTVLGSFHSEMGHGSPKFWRACVEFLDPVQSASLAWSESEWLPWAKMVPGQAPQE